MAQFYAMPAISPTMELGSLVSWKVKEGASFESGTILAEVGTDKANMDAEIFDEGVLIKHLVPEGAEIPPGYPIAIWGESVDEDIAGLLEEFKSRSAVPAPAPSSEAPSASPAPVATSVSAPATPSAPLQELARTWMGKTLPPSFQEPPGDICAAPTARPKASPLARKIAAARSINLHSVKGTGPGGRILQADVVSAPAGGSPHPTRADEAVRNSPMRKTIAKRLLQSHQQIPVFFLTATFDMQGFVDLRAQLKTNLPDVRVSYNDILIKAVAAALTEHPYANAQWSDDSILLRGSVDIGVAVALPDGLITPVVRGADQKSLSTIGAEVRALAARAKEGKLAPEEYTGGSFTISNLGMMQIEQFTAIINPPEVGILAVGAIEQVPVVIDGALSTGWRMKVTMSCDHRVIDGAVGAAFLQTLRRYVENPYLLLV